MRNPPLKLMMVLHYHCHPSCVKPAFSETSPAYKQFLSELQQDGILTIGADGGPAVTEKGKVYVDGLCTLDYPSQRWGYTS